MKFRYLISLALVAALGMTSCSDFLDKETDTRVTLTNVEQLRMLMASAYPTANYAIICELSSDNMIDNNSPNDNGIRYNLPSYTRNDDEAFAWEDIRSESSSDSPSDLWESYYHSIATANATLEKIEELEAAGQSDAKQDAVKGEALLVRAYCHWMLANIFCMPYRGPELSKQYPGIPYITKPETEVLVHYDRENLAVTYDKIQSDVEDGLKLVNDLIYEVPKYHFNKQAAFAFAARFYLFKRDYERVLECANTAFGGADVDPSPYLTDIWSRTDLTSFVEGNRYYASTTQQRNFLVYPCHSLLVRHLYGGRRYAVNRESLRATLRGPGPTWQQEVYYMKDDPSDQFALHPCFSALWVNGQSEYGAYWGYAVGEHFEYTDKIAGIGYAHNMRCEFTGDELLLTRAEAKLFLGDIDGCFSDLNVWEYQHRRYISAADLKYMNDFTKDALVQFYNNAQSMYEENYANTGLNGYGRKIRYGIAKPIHIDEVCPSDKYQLTAEMTPYLQCIQHFRRIENIHNGLRWFDIKRLGLSYHHKIGRDGTIHWLKTLDSRYALQIPNEIISAGLEKNERQVDAPDPGEHTEAYNFNIMTIK